jgi:hypothetical protein
VWSVDAWRAQRNRALPVPPLDWLPIAPLRLLRFQVSLIYLSAGLWKLYSPLWRDGSAVHYVLNTNIYHRFPDALPPSLDGLTTVLTYATLFWEVAFAFFVLYRPTRKPVLIAGVLFHLGMLASMEVGPFHIVMLSGYVAFLDPFRAARLRAPAREPGQQCKTVTVSLEERA